MKIWITSSLPGVVSMHPDNTNGFAWGNETLKKNLLKGVIRICCSSPPYGVLPRLVFSAPADNTGESKRKVQSFVFFLLQQPPTKRTGDRVLDAWLAANLNKIEPRPAIVYTQNHYWQVNVKYRALWSSEVELDTTNPVIDQPW